jgi:hypothetical protein
MYAAPFPFLDYQTPVVGCFLLLMKKFLALVIIALSDVVGAVTKIRNVGDLKKSFHKNADADINAASQGANVGLPIKGKKENNIHPNEDNNKILSNNKNGNKHENNNKNKKKNDHDVSNNKKKPKVNSK